jgi:glycosyltransferase involved in cell wall biosynthesis
MDARSGVSRGAAPRESVIHLIESDGLYGAESVVLALAAQGSQDPGFPPVIGCIVGDASAPNALYDRAKSLGLEAAKLELRNRYAPIDVVRVTAKLKGLGIGLIHAHGYKATILGYWAHRVNATPILATCHLWFEDSQCKWTYRLLTKLEMRLYRRFRRVVAVSQPIADTLAAHGVWAERLTVIPNGIPAAERVSETSEGWEALRLRFKPDVDSRVVLNVGRLSEQKAQADLIDAASLLIREYPALQVVIVGEGHLRSTLEAQIQRLSLTGHVHLPGFTDRVSDYLALADVFVLPSLDEGLPIALLEAIAAGVPVIATGVGDIPQLLEHGATGLTIPGRNPGAIRDAVDRLFSEPALGRRLADEGKDRLLRVHTAERMYEAYRCRYLELVGEKE